MEKKKSPKHTNQPRTTGSPSKGPPPRNKSGSLAGPQPRFNGGRAVAAQASTSTGPSDGPRPSNNSGSGSKPHPEGASSVVPQAGTNNASPQGEIAKNRLVVSGYPVYAQERELEYLFAEFGAPRVMYMDGRSAVMRFRSADDVAAVLRAPRPMLYASLLSLTTDDCRRRCGRPWRNRDKNERRQMVQHSSTREDELDPANIDFSGDFHTQLATVLSTVRLTQEEVSNISKLYADVEEILQELWPGCTAMPFGSITSGLGIKTSDADCFVDIPPQLRHGEQFFVLRAKKLLARFPGIFRQVVCIPRANTPIVKFFHMSTKTNCDVSFKTPLGVRNSQLIAFLLHVDPRLIPVAVLIKYWGKVGGFTGSGKLTNYALTMLLLFYLQQVHILPSVFWLQTGTARYEVDCWNTGFKQNYEDLPKTKCESSIPDLIGGFFQYYSTFNFKEEVVCPFLGRAIKKCLFDLNDLPDEYDLYKHNVKAGYGHPLRVVNTICIQDPFDLSHNVASVISERCAVEIQAYFSFAATAFEKGKQYNYEHFLKKILTEKPIIPGKKSSPVFSAVIKEQDLNDIRGLDWQSVVRDVTFKIFEHILKLKFAKVADIKLPPKTAKPRKSRKERYVSVLNKTIWKRKQFSKLYNMMDLNFTEKQARITEEIIRIDKSELNVKFQLTLHFSEVNRKANISLRSLRECTQSFREFGQFFLSIAPLWFEQLLQPFLVPTINDNQIPKIQKIDEPQTDVQDIGEAPSSTEDDDSDDDAAATEVVDDSAPVPVKSDIVNSSAAPVRVKRDAVDRSRPPDDVKGDFIVRSAAPVHITSDIETSTTQGHLAESVVEQGD